MPPLLGAIFPIETYGLKTHLKVQKDPGKKRGPSKRSEKDSWVIKKHGRAANRLVGKGGGTMNKILTILAVICLLGFGFVACSNAEPFTFQWGSISSETIDLLGTPVYNPGGEMLGTINAFLIDSEGRVDFAILWQGAPLKDIGEDIRAARYVAVPLSALSITRKGPAEVTVVLNMDRGTLDSAPSFDRTHNPNHSEWAVRIYRYFGQTPYWTEEEAGKAGPAANSSEGGQDYPY